MAITAFTSTAIIDATTIGTTVLTASTEGIAADAIGLGATDDVTFNSIASVDGDFSGTVSTDTISSSTGLSHLSFTGSVVVNRPMRPDQTGIRQCGLSSYRWSEVYSVNGSFSGSLVSEAGGSYKLYNLGTEGDTDTEYLETLSSANDYYIKANQTGTGIIRSLYLEGQSVRLQIGGSPKLSVLSTGTFCYTDVSPNANATASLGQSGARWANTYSVDGDFSGDVIMAANVDFTGLPTADPVVAGRLWNDSGTLKISAG